jgi:hypothetical protein
MKGLRSQTHKNIIDPWDLHWGQDQENIIDPWDFANIIDPWPWDLHWGQDQG